MKKFIKRLNEGVHPPAKLPASPKRKPARVLRQAKRRSPVSLKDISNKVSTQGKEDESIVKCENCDKPVENGLRVTAGPDEGHVFCDPNCHTEWHNKQ